MDEEPTAETAQAAEEPARPLELAPALKLTVCVGGDERHARRPLFREVLKVLRECNVAGATLTKGVLSFGEGRRVHSDMNEVTMENLPFVVEAVGGRVEVERAAVRVAKLLGGHGLVQLQPTMLARARGVEGRQPLPEEGRQPPAEEG